MRDIYSQYPDIYRKQNDTYLYFGDDGTRFYLVAGKDGVTEEWIEKLKAEHRKEYNMIRETKRKRLTVEAHDSVFISLDFSDSEYVDRVLNLVDPALSGIDALVYQEKASEFHRIFDKAWHSLTEKQRRLIVMVRLQKIPQKEIARQNGVSCVAINHQLAVIDRKLNQILNKDYFRN